MNAARDAFEDTQDIRAVSPRLREIPYNYTSFSDREIVIRLLGEPRVGRARRAARRAPHRPLREDALRGARRHLGRRAQPVPRRTSCSTYPKRRAALIAEMRDRLRRDRSAAQRSRSERARDAAARRPRAQAVDALREPVRATRWRSARSASRRARARTRASDNIQFDGLARVSHVTDATDWRVEYPFVVAQSRHRGGSRAASSRRCIELGLTIIPRGGGTGYTGGAIPLDARSRRSSTPRSSSALSAIERVVLPGLDRSRCRSFAAARASSRKRAMEAADARGPRVRRAIRLRPTRRASAATSR